MQLSSVDHVEALLANTMKPRHDFFRERFHSSRVSFITGEVEVHVLANKTIRHTREPSERILDTPTKNFLTQHVVINRHAERKLSVGTRTAIPKLQVVFPAGEEEFPLQIRHLQ